MVALRRWKARRGSKKGQIEHDRDDVLAGWRGRLPWRTPPGELYFKRTLPPFAVEEALNGYYPESEVSHTAILESVLADLLLGPSEWLGCLVVSRDEGIDVLLQIARRR
jgi:hypothetical protein